MVGRPDSTERTNGLLPLAERLVPEMLPQRLGQLHLLLLTHAVRGTSETGSGGGHAPPPRWRPQSLRQHFGYEASARGRRAIVRSVLSGRPTIAICHRRRQEPLLSVAGAVARRHHGGVSPLVA